MSTSNNQGTINNKETMTIMDGENGIVSVSRRPECEEVQRPVYAEYDQKETRIQLKPHRSTCTGTTTTTTTTATATARVTGVCRRGRSRPFLFSISFFFLSMWNILSGHVSTPRISFVQANNQQQQQQQEEEQELSLRQDVIVDEICGCSPSNYSIVLDFSLFCPPVEVGRGNGIGEISCIISPLGAPSSDLEPVRLLNVDFLELDQNNNVLTQERIDGGFVDGDTVVYTSILGRDVDLAVEQIPRAFQMNLNGVNADGVALISVFVITFTNECGILPVLDPGESAGWAVFDDLGFPNLDYCSTFAPTNLPTEAPTLAPTQRPTPAPTPNPTPQPTQVETPDPTQQPTQVDTPNPTQRPTQRPTQQPTQIPATGSPTERPVETTPVPTESQATEAPTVMPAEPPQPIPSTSQPTAQPSPPSQPTPRPTPVVTTTIVPSTISAIPTTMFSMSMSMDLILSENTLGEHSLRLLEEDFDSSDQFWKVN